MWEKVFCVYPLEYDRAGVPRRSPMLHLEIVNIGSMTLVHEHTSNLFIIQLLSPIAITDITLP